MRKTKRCIHYTSEMALFVETFNSTVQNLLSCSKKFTEKHPSHSKNIIIKKPLNFLGCANSEETKTEDNTLKGTGVRNIFDQAHATVSIYLLIKIGKPFYFGCFSRNCAKGL